MSPKRASAMPASCSRVAIAMTTPSRGRALSVAVLAPFPMATSDRIESPEERLQRQRFAGHAQALRQVARDAAFAAGSEGQVEQLVLLQRRVGGGPGELQLAGFVLADADEAARAELAGAELREAER